MYVERQGFSIAFTAMARSAAIDEGVKGSVFSDFYWGYGLSQIPGGAAAQRLGGHWMLLVSFLLWSMAEVLTPTDASYTLGVATARVLVGAAQGFIIPSVHTVLAQVGGSVGAPVLLSPVILGMYLGSASALYFLPSVVSYYGPGRVLKLVGGLGLSWLLLWLCVGRKPPPVRLNELPVAVGHKGQPNVDNAIPWRGMFTALPIWAIVLNNFTFHYAVYVVLNWLPTYFHSLLQQDLADLGAVKTVPFLLMFITSNAGGWAGDWLIMKGASRRAGRVIVNTAGFWGAALFLILMPFAGGVTSGVLYTSLAMGFLGFSRGGFSVNHMDVTPGHAGVVMGFSNTAGDGWLTTRKARWSFDVLHVVR
eukprot:evm.model.scf_728EXC.7 EVM.evm.TU.scf_728EXC.7   scf_728EXC:40676-43413(-)